MQATLNERADGVIAGLVAKLQGEVTISSLIDVSGLGASAFSAVVRVIAKGMAHLPRAHLLDYPATLSRTMPHWRQAREPRPLGQQHLSRLQSSQSSLPGSGQAFKRDQKDKAITE
ncbi:MAG: hypothetical protein H7245_00950 [Candidatus Saccharibacteria bacterium]|nr:hypothetical protein [Pseudorhodobacter sp.]